MRAKRAPSAYATAVEVDEQHGWGRYVRGGVDVQMCPGNHTTICEQPHVRVLAQRLREAIDRALGTSSREDAPPLSASVARFSMSSRPPLERIAPNLRAVLTLARRFGGRCSAVTRSEVCCERTHGGISEHVDERETFPQFGAEVAHSRA